MISPRSTNGRQLVRSGHLYAVSPAQAHTELGWRPAFPTYLDGIANMVATVRQAAASAR
jgi:hypothetical protein